MLREFAGDGNAGAGDGGVVAVSAGNVGGTHGMVLCLAQLMC